MFYALCTCTPPHPSPPPTPAVPSVPQNVRVTSNNSTSLHVTWQPPATPNGQPSYVIYYGPSPSANMSLEQPFEARSADIINLAPYTYYSIVVSAKTTCGENRSQAKPGRTDESISSPVRDLTVTASLPTSVTVQWRPPVTPNGLIQNYTVSPLIQ